MNNNDRSLALDALSDAAKRFGFEVQGQYGVQREGHRQGQYRRSITIAFWEDKNDG